MRSCKGELINMICDCGYESGYIDPIDALKKIRGDGGTAEGDTHGNTINLYSSVCPKCEAVNSFDVDIEDTVYEDEFTKHSATRRL